MFEISLFNDRVSFKIDTQHYHANSFVFGMDLSSVGVIYAYHNGDKDNEPITETCQEYSWNIWLGLISFHIGFRGKSEEEVV